MKFLRWMAACLRGGSAGFTVLETAILDETARRLDADRADRLRRRIAAVNLVQRPDGGREANAYVLRRGRPTLDPALRLSAEDGERRLATFSFRGSDGRRLRGAAWLVDGQMFSLEFNGVTEHILDDPPEDLRVSILAEPSYPLDDERSPRPQGWR